MILGLTSMLLHPLGSLALTLAIFVSFLRHEKATKKKNGDNMFDTDTETLTLRQIEVNQSAACAVLVTPYAKNPSLKLHCLSFIAAAGSFQVSARGMVCFFQQKKHVYLITW
jgi:hypothetical protein